MWGDKNNTNLESLFILQKKVIRTCTNSLWLEHTTPIFIALKTLKIHDLYQLAIHMFRHHRNLLPLDLSSISFINQSDIHNYNTRHVSDLHIAPTNTKLAGNTITTQGPIIWKFPYLTHCCYHLIAMHKAHSSITFVTKKVEKFTFEWL